MHGVANDERRSRLVGNLAALDVLESEAARA
jgi:hypothetical protein